jgi:transcriptional regulator with XRE-family HTH domain
MDGTLQRILGLMKEKRITDLEMQEYLGLPRGAFSNWKRGMGRSYYEHISKIADRLEVTIDYLVRGEDVKTDSLTHDEIELISDFRKMTKEGKKIIASNIKLIVGG